MKAHGHFLILSFLVVILSLALVGCKREPCAGPTPPLVVRDGHPDGDQAANDICGLIP
jgi:hypothetical protein